MLYKKQPARLCLPGEPLEIELESGKRLKVRPKDVTLLHPGPLQDLKQLVDLDGDVNTAWELLAADGAVHTLPELAELAFGAFSPASAWAAWRILDDGLYFSGTPAALYPRPADEVAAERASRQSRMMQTKAWSEFVNRARLGQVDLTRDQRFLLETIDLAFGRRGDSRLLRELGHVERPETAHAWLLENKIWDWSVNPYPARQRLVTSSVELAVPALEPEPRHDFTHLAAFAIDDQGNQDPDDALSLEGERLWVHVADPAAVITPDSPLDREARGRGANLYLPEGITGMLPPIAVQTFGLGLSEISPAMSFGLHLGPAGELIDYEITPSWVRVERLTYEQADTRMEQEPFRSMYELAWRYHQRRKLSDAVEFNLPEVSLHVMEGQVIIRPVLELRSRVMVKEAMLMAGEAAARFALDRDLPFPYTTQEPVAPFQLADILTQRGRGQPTDSNDLALGFALRRAQKRSQTSGLPGPHAGLGLPLYGRVTSPLRRYSDLLAHQQLRASLRTQPALEMTTLLEHIGEAEAASGAANFVESLSRRHWTLVYLQQHPGWRGEAVLVDKSHNQRAAKGRLILPEIALETQIHLRADLPLNSRLNLLFNGMNLAELEAYFSIETTG